jgi:hypothetical protein
MSPSRRRALVVLGRSALVAVTLATAGTGWVALHGLHARRHLERAATLVADLRTQIQDRAPTIASTLAELQAATRAARADTADPGWRLAQHVPMVGANLGALTTVADTLDQLSHDGLPPLAAAAGGMSEKALLPTAGRFDLSSWQRVTPDLQAAELAVRRAHDRIAGIALDGLVPQLRSVVEQLTGMLARAATITGTTARAATLLPPMLGAAGRRTYLVLFQNLAEIRATGGMPGAYVVLAADHGAITLIDQGSAAGLETFGRPVLPWPENLRSLYTDRPARLPADINFTPDFPTAATLAREMYRRRFGRTVDGVIATDPVALSYLLDGIGPVDVPGGERLTAADAVRVLQSQIYDGKWSFDRQNLYFAAAAREIFRAMLSRTVQPARLLGLLSKAAGERRLLVWSADPGQEQALAGTVLGGVLPASDGDRPTVGVFLNDGSGAKLDYYLTHSADLAVTPSCRDDGRRELTLRVTLGSTAPARGLSPVVLGMGLSGDPYTSRTNVAIYSPTGGVVDDVTMNGVRVPFGSGTDRRRAVAVVTVDLEPGATRTIEATLLSGVPAVQNGPRTVPRLRVTPGINGWQQSVSPADVCRSRR